MIASAFEISALLGGERSAYAGMSRFNTLLSACVESRHSKSIVLSPKTSLSDTTPTYSHAYRAEVLVVPRAVASVDARGLARADGEVSVLLHVLQHSLSCSAIETVETISNQVIHAQTARPTRRTCTSLLKLDLSCGVAIGQQNRNSYSTR